jgi:hypothetical protein
MGKPAGSLLKHDDFIELKYDVKARNTTTRAQANPDAVITITELRPKGLVLRMPKGSCSNGHNLLIDIKPRTNLKPKKPAGKVVALSKAKDPAVIEITAHVRSVQENWDNTLLVELDLYQFDEKKWKAFLAAFEERQDSIHRLVKRVRE